MLSSNQTNLKNNRLKTSWFIVGLFWIVLILIIMYYELLVRFFTEPSFTFFPTLYGLAFSVSIATTLVAILAIFSKNWWRILWLMFGILVFTYGSQLFYYSNFKTFYTFYSLMNSSQITDFYREMIILILRYWYYVFFVVIPIFPLFYLHRKFKTFDFYLETKGVIVLFAGVLHGIILMFTLASQENIKQLYMTNSQMTQSIQQYGLFTSMRIDLRENAKDILPFLEPNPQTIPTIDLPDNPLPPTDPDVLYNNLAIDWDKLNKNTSDDVLLNMHDYFSKQQPSNQNEYTGLFKDMNLILITAEAYSHYAVHPEVTPTLYHMANHGIVFENFYNPVWGVSTSDGEYVVLTGLIPKSGVWSLEDSSTNNMMLTYARQLESIGYHNMAFHNHTYTYYKRHLSHPNLGYEYIGVGNGLEPSRVWPSSDLEMMEQTVPMYVNQTPFHTYYMTVSGHQFYTWNGNMMASKNRDSVAGLSYSEHVKAYMATQVELDRALENLLNQLKAAGQYENTVIVISADHYPYGLTHDEIEELAKQSIDPIMELHRSSLIIYHPMIDPIYVSDVTSSLDILPTISNLFGLTYDSRLLMGRDVFSDTSPLVIFKDRSFMIEEGRYFTGSKRFEPHPGFDSIDELQINRLIQQVDAKFYYSAQILDYDYYDVIFDAIVNELPPNIPDQD